MAEGITNIFNTFQDYLNTEQGIREVRIDVSPAGTLSMIVPTPD